MTDSQPLKRRIVHTVQRLVVNPVGRRLPLTMLETVGHPVVVNPDRPLQKTARERNWEVREFVRPVRLRDRMPARPGRATTVIGVSLALGGGAAVVVWRLRSRELSQAVISRLGAFELRKPSGRSGLLRGGASS